MRLQGNGSWQDPVPTEELTSEEQAAEQTAEQTTQAQPVVEATAIEAEIYIAPVAKPTGPGYRLRLAREALNLTQEEVAARLRLTRQMIQFIDLDNYNLPTPRTFLRGYLRAYANLVDVSPDEIVAAFEMIPMQETAMNVQLPSPATRQTWRKKESSMRWFMYVVASIALVVTALAYQWWHSYNKVIPSDTAADATQKTTQTEAVPGQLVQPAAAPIQGQAQVPAQGQAVALDLTFSAPVNVKLVDREGKVLHEGKYDRNDHVSYDQVAAYEIIVDQPDNVSVRYHGRLLMPVRYPGETFARIILQPEQTQ